MNAYLSIPLVLAVFCIVLVALVLRRHSRSLTHRLFSFYLLTVALWGVLIFGMRASPDVEHAYDWERILIPVGVFMPVMFYHFSVRFTVTQIKGWLLPVLYSVCFFLFISLAATDLIISGMQIKSYGYAPIFGPLAPLWLLFIYVIPAVALLTFVRYYKRSALPEQRNRVAYIIMGMIFIFVGGAFDILPAIGLPLYPGFIIGNIIFCLLTTVAIVRHSLLDIRVVLRKSTAYFLTSALIAFPFVGIFLLVINAYTEVGFPLWAYLAMFIVLALVIPALWQIAQRRADKWFYRDRYDYLKALEAFGRNTQSITDSATLGSNMVNLVAGALRTSSVYLLQPVSHSGDFAVVSSAAVNNPAVNILLSNRGPLIKWLIRSDGVLPYRDLDIIPQLQSVVFKEKESLQKVRAELIAPLKARTGQLSGVLILGEKLSGQPYTIEDKQLIRTLSSQLAIKLENARLYNASQQELMERKQAEEREKKLQQELNLSSRLASIGELAAGVAHEINNPLTGIIGFSQRLLRKSADEEVKRNLEIIYTEAQRAAKVVQNLLTFAHRHEAKKQYSDINVALEMTLELRAYELRTSNIQLVVELTPGIPKTMVDFQRIQEVFLNLILNGEQAMSEAHNGGKLTIKTQEINDYIRISFTDDGPGIPAEHLDKLFDPFFTTRGEKGGTGLGLSVCHGTVTEHDGKIYAKSIRGQGATFFVELPIVSETADKNKVRKQETILKPHN